MAGDTGDPQKVAQGVSLVVIVFTGMNLRQETVDIELLRWVAPAAIIAAFLAAIGANRVDDAVLRRIYGRTALLLGIETVYTNVRGLRSGRRAEEIEAV